MSEQWYDEEIAPALLALAKKCEEKGIAFVSTVEYAPGEMSSTISIPKTAGIAARIAAIAARCGGNLDGLVISVLRYCRQEGVDTSRSIVAQRWASHDAA